MRGVVNSVTPAGRGIDRKGQMTLLFDRFTIDGRTYSTRATVTQALQGTVDGGKRRHDDNTGIGLMGVDPSQHRVRLQAGQDIIENDDLV